MIETNLLAPDLEAVLAGTRDLWPEFRGKRLFITGATGFFGSWLLETFAWANSHLELHAQAAILTRDPAGFARTLPHIANSGLEVLVGDVRNFQFPRGEFSHVIHAATDASADLNANNPQLMFDTIVEGTRHCLEFALHSGAHKFLFTSSGAVYGKQPPNLTHVPEDFTGSPDSLVADSAYGEGKRAAELLCALAAKNGALEAKIARCFAFVGPRMKLDAHFAIGNFMRDRLEGRRIVVRGDGTPVRSYMYASDLMIWLWTILFRGKSCRAYNVGSEDGISIADLAREVAELDLSPVDEWARKGQVEILGTAVPGGPIARYVPSTERARGELGLRCSVGIKDAIKRTVEWNIRFRRSPNAAEPAGVMP